jgi:hypothetical protein
MKVTGSLVAFAVHCAITERVQAAEAPSRETLEKMFVMHEAEWAAQPCTHTVVETDLLWDDFIGTDTRGGRYSMQQSIEESKADSTRARDCRLLEAQVHFYSGDVAVVFGSETAVEAKPDGGEERRCLYWTDTWLRRAGQWRIAARSKTPDCRAPRAYDCRRPISGHPRRLANFLA